MPTELKCIIYEARNLPIMEKSRNTTDAYCLVQFGRIGGLDGAGTIFQTETVYNALNPKWQQATFAFEKIDDEQLQENVLEIKVVDEDVINRENLVGTVLIELSSLLNRGDNN